MFYSILKKVGIALLTILVAVTVIFFMLRLAPGGPMDMSRPLPPEVKEVLMAKWGLDKPLNEQYLKFLVDLIHFDFGPSYHNQGRSVKSLILEGLPPTMLIGGLSILVATVLGVFAGIFAAVRHNRPADYTIMALAMFGVAVPEFVLGPVLILVFALGLNWLPVQGYGNSWKELVLPVSTLSLYYVAVISRITRGKMIEVLQQDFVRTARAKGLSEMRVIFGHAVRGGISATVTYLGVAIAGIMTGGTLIVENLYNVPGLGKYFIDAATSRDYPLVMGTSIVFLVSLIIMNNIVEIIYVVLDPRLRKGGK